MSKASVSFQRRPFLTPIWLTAIFSVAGTGIVAVLVVAIWVWATAACTTVIVIRHAEKDMTTGSADPPLTAAGIARAQLLARMFGDVRQSGHVDHIYVSPALRNRLTAAPLAARLGIAAVVVAQDDPRELARRALREHAGERILIVGHSDTVPPIVQQLSGRKDIPEIADEDYSEMYIVSVPRIGRPNLLHLSL